MSRRPHLNGRGWKDGMASGEKGWWWYIVMVGEKSAGEPRTQPRQYGRVLGGSIILSGVIPRKHAGFFLFFHEVFQKVTSRSFDEAIIECDWSPLMSRRFPPSVVQFRWLTWCSIEGMKSKWPKRLSDFQVIMTHQGQEKGISCRRCEHKRIWCNSTRAHILPTSPETASQVTQASRHS